MVMPVPNCFDLLTEELAIANRDPAVREVVADLSTQDDIRNTAAMRWLVRAIVEGSGEGARPEMFAMWKGRDHGDALHVLRTALGSNLPSQLLSTLAVCTLTAASVYLKSPAMRQYAAEQI